jgi:hypothetical protein
MVAKCKDCNMPYDEFQLDSTLPDDQWSMIAKTEEILCANCIVKRASRLPGIIAVRFYLDIVGLENQMPSGLSRRVDLERANSR